MAEEKQMSAEESTFRAQAYETITGLMSENAKLKDSYGRAAKKSKASQRGSSTIKGFKGFKGF